MLPESRSVDDLVGEVDELTGDIVDDGDIYTEAWGDVDEGDLEEGDYDGDIDEGDVDDLGDLDPYGDAYETGGPRRRRRHRLRDRIRARRAARRARRAAKHKKAKIKSGAIPGNAKIPFLDIERGIIKVANIQFDLCFDAADREAMMTFVYNQAPYKSYVVSRLADGSITIDANSVQPGATTLLFPFFVIKIGDSALNGVSNSVFNVTVTTKNALGTTLSLGTTTILSMKNAVPDIVMAVTPWTLVASVPRPTIGQLTAVPADFTFTIAGGTATTKSTVIIPGRDESSVNAVLAKMRT